MSGGLRHLASTAAKALTSRFDECGERPVAFVQTGSGLTTAGLFDEIVAEFPLAALPGMPEASSPAGHALTLQLGLCGETPVLAAQGRRHFYEGFGVVPCVLPVCAAVLTGLKRVVLVAAASSVNPEFRPGAVVALTDFINRLGTTPLMGSEPLGERYFPDMNDAYCQALISDFINCLPAGEPPIRLGVYQANCGPQYETPAEVAAARRNGADLVGMSLVLETIAARALGAEVLGLAVVANLADDKRPTTPAREKITAVVAATAPALTNTLKRFLAAG